MLKERTKESIKFKAKAVIYENETGFKIIAGVAFNPDSGERIRKCSMKGQMFDVNDGDEVFATGDWDEHPKYGIGFKMDAYVKIIPQDKKSILRYLSQGNISGISPRRAEAIVKRFGDNTFDVLIYQTHLLQEIKGIGKKSIEKIQKCAKEKLEEQNMIQTIMMYIQGYGISPAYANRIYKRYGLESIRMIQKNPYQLADDVKGIGFLKADDIALKNGIPKDSPFRVESAVMYVLKKMSEDGDVFGSRNEVERTCSDFLELDISHVENTVKSLVKKNKIVCEDDALYLIPLYKAEVYAAKRIVKLLQNTTRSISVTKKEIEEMGRTLGIEYAPEQIQAIASACKSNVLILTGGPGTGKTTTVQGIIYMLKKHGMKVLCAAPTGKASKRMKEATGEPAQTIHKTLEVSSEGAYGFKFGRNEKNPLEGDVLIIDESSMIDMELMAAVLKAIPDGMKLILVGDIDQLPSVGCGNVLHEMIDSKVVPLVRLQTIFRQAQESQIIQNAHAINKGEIPSFKNQKSGDYFFMDVDGMEQEQIRDCIVTYVCEKLPKYYHVAPDEIQVLAPMKKGATGVWELNDYIQNRINPPSTDKPIIPCNDHLLRVGDKVMYTCNDYDKKVFNGDVGKIVSIYTPSDEESEDEDNEKRKGFVVDFDGNKIQFDINKAQDFILAYATTIHKSQGSEYDIVVMPLTNANYIMLQRNLLYTGVTRAKKVFVLFGQKTAVARAVRNQTVVRRNTRFGARIIDIAEFLPKKRAVKKRVAKKRTA